MPQGGLWHQSRGRSPIAVNRSCTAPRPRRESACISRSVARSGSGGSPPSLTRSTTPAVRAACPWLASAALRYHCSDISGSPTAHSASCAESGVHVAEHDTRLWGRYARISACGGDVTTDRPVRHLLSLWIRRQNKGFGSSSISGATAELRSFQATVMRIGAGAASGSLKADRAGYLPRCRGSAAGSHS
ncbi:Uncharacterised protein [Mycobacteroides abscessus subsp. abscessus]|nr:Uncharacterised protein [Mycobacteroides abscessus subsp. abscessus]SKT54988.1 Uncharacterised protein [Mycobacteroides abscessus subsp. massiliense]SLC78656.1 Uncharacterised protein [Mycobacteroides abscessus subsp. abscessus]